MAAFHPGKLVAVLLTLGFLEHLALAEDKLAEAKPIADGDLAKWVDKRVKSWQPTPEEKRFDEIGWCRSLLEAEKLAKEHKRPIFWFTHDGRIDKGRC